MFKRVPRNIDLKVGSITILNTIKDDLDLYLKFVQETSGEDTSLNEVLAFCISNTIGNDREFLKYKKELSAKK